MLTEALGKIVRTNFSKAQNQKEFTKQRLCTSSYKFVVQRGSKIYVEKKSVKPKPAEYCPT